jgi:glycosyltransferase involved in cell wall biosynthesis
MKLSILIPTLNEPRNIQCLKRLRNILDPQVARYPGQVEIVINDAGRSMPTGTKRNKLIEGSTGEYFCFIDDDDRVPMYYIDELMKAIEREPDVITFIGYMTTNGTRTEHFTIKLGSEYVTRNSHHYRFPNHLCCFKRSLVEKVKFEPIYQQEDYRWAKQINDSRILKNEVHIAKHMYWYDFDSTKKPNRKP